MSFEAGPAIRTSWLALKWGGAAILLTVASVILWQEDRTAFALFLAVLLGAFRMEQLRRKLDNFEQRYRSAQLSAELERLRQERFKLLLDGLAAKDVSASEETVAGLRRMHSKLIALDPSANGIEEAKTAMRG